METSSRPVCSGRLVGVSPTRWRLVTAYDDPQLRDQIHALICVADQEQRFRAWLVAEEDRTGEYELVV